MNKLGKNSVAIFLAAALVTGIFALASPSFIDVEASGDQRDKYKDNRHDKSKSVIVKKFICNNINIGGISIDVNPRDIVSSLAGAQAQEEEGKQGVSANSIGNSERNQGYKQGHGGGDFTYICINNGGGGNVPPVVVEDCEDCFITTNNGGFVPPGQLRNLVEFLDENFRGATLEDLCRAIESGIISEEFLEQILNAALPGAQPRLVGLLLDCLSEFFLPEERPITENSPFTQTP